MIAVRISTMGFLAVLAGLVGCQQKPVDLAEMMKPPPRPPELDRLNLLVGRWENTFEMKMAGSEKPSTGKGTSTASWEADKWLLVERFDVTMEGDKVSGLGLWTWDPRAKAYRVSWYDSAGNTTSGKATYDDKNRTWQWRAKGYIAKTGQTTTSEGTMRFVDDNTMEWSGTDWDSWRLRKLMEGKGTSRRKP